MGGAARRAAALAAAMLALGACAGQRIENGIYRAPSGYRVSVPAAGWDVVEDTRADLELRQRSAAAGMLVNGLCDARTARHDATALTVQLLIGLRDRVTLVSDEARVDGRVAAHRLVEGRMQHSDQRVRVEAYTLTNERCVWDLLYVARPAVFDGGRADFQRFVDSFHGE